MKHVPLLGILALALLARAVPLGAGLPYLGYIDEGHVLHPVITLLKTHGWDPRWYLHPSLTIYMITGLVHLARPVYRMVHGHSLLLDLPADETYYDFVSPPDVIFLGRTLIAIFSVATTALVWVLARRHGGRRAAILAAVFAALCPALVTRGSIVIIDSVATFFALATLYFAQRLEGRGPEASLPGAAESSLVRSRDSILAGVCAGLSFTAKYTIGVVFLAVAFVILTRPDRLRDRLRLLVLSGGAAICIAAVTMPAIVLRTRAVVAAILEQSWLYAHPTEYLFAFSPEGPGYFRQAIDPNEVGIPLSVAGLVGLGWALSDRRTRTMASSWLLFGSVLLATLLLHPFQAFRNALPLVPLLCIAASLPLASKASPRRWRGRLKTLAASVLVAGMVPGLLDAWRMRRVEDSRVLLVDELARDRWAGKRVLVERELAILPAELRRARAALTVVPWSEMKQLARSGSFDAIVFGDFDTDSAPPVPWLAGIDDWRSWTAGLPVVHSVGSQRTPVYPNFWRGSDERARLALLPVAAAR